MGTYCRSRHIGIAIERVRRSYAIHRCSRPACTDAFHDPLLNFMLYPCNTAAPKRDGFGKEPIGDVLVDGRSAQACGMTDVGKANEAHGSDPVWLVQTISECCFFSCPKPFVPLAWGWTTPREQRPQQPSKDG